MKTELTIIGGGAAGLMAACHAAEEGAQVLVLDRNHRPGRKLRITGKGRCNLTNDCTVQELLRNINGDGRFLYRALADFAPSDVMRWFEEQGLALKTERGRRVFPTSDNANDVADLLVRLCRERGVRFREERAVGLSVKEGAVVGVKTEREKIDCRACIICTGGLSYPLTGSDGDGYRMARSMGHSVTPLRASLVPLESPAACCERLSGLSLKNVSLSLYEGEKLLYREQGEMLFTHFGISGPLVLSASARLGERSGEGELRAVIDLKPALDEKTLDARLLRDLQKFHNRGMENALAELLPKSLIPEVLEATGIPARLPANSLTREQRGCLLRCLKGFSLPISGTRPIDEAVITAGGVKLKEINPRDMQSKLIHGLFFAGEVIDLDAVTGGYNLQIAWATGRLAGLSAANYINTGASRPEESEK